MDVKFQQYKKEFSYSYAYGVFPTLELLSHRKEEVIKVLLHSKGQNNKGILEIKNISKKNNIPIEIADKLIEKLTASKNNYAIGIFKKYKNELDPKSNHLVLVNPSDMGNMGTIIRTMVGFAITNLVIIKPGADIFDPKVIRASMGALFQVKFSYFESFTLYNNLPRNNYTFITDATYPLRAITFKKPFSLIFGNESSGLGEEYYHIGTKVKIPQTATIDSLSLPIAAGIALYETYQTL